MDEATREFLIRLLKLRERMSPDSIADFFRDVPPPPRAPPPPPFGAPPVLGIGLLGWTLIAAAAVALAADRIKNAVDETGATTVGGGGPDCGNPAMATTTLAPVTGRSFWGGTAAFNNAIEEAEKVCAALSPLCTGSCETGTCRAPCPSRESPIRGHGTLPGRTARSRSVRRALASESLLRASMVRAFVAEDTDGA